MSKFFKQFFAVLATLRNECDHVILVKQNVTVTDPIEVVYALILTPYALRYYSLLLFFFHIMITIIVDLCLSNLSYKVVRIIFET